MSAIIGFTETPEENMRLYIEGKALLLAQLPSTRVIMVTTLGPAERVPLIIGGASLDQMRPRLIAECQIALAEGQAKLIAMQGGKQQ